MATHDLRVRPRFFEELWAGNKTFEIRKDDRGFQRGDALLLREYDISVGEGDDCYTGREVEAQVVYISRYMQREGHIVMALKQTVRRDRYSQTTLSRRGP